MGLYAYVYLLGALFFLCLLLVVVLLRPDLRRQALVTALAFLPAGPIAELAYFRDYWSPPSRLAVQILGHRVLLEDFVFAFAGVGLMSVFADFVTRRTPVPGVAKERKLLAIVLSLVYIVLLVVLPLVTKLNSIAFGSALPLALWSLMMLLRPDLLPSSLLNGLLCTACALGFYVVYLNVLPGDYLAAVWKLSGARASFGLLGARIPATELAWACSTSLYFGALYKLAVGSGYATARRRHLHRGKGNRRCGTGKNRAQGSHSAQSESSPSQEKHATADLVCRYEDRVLSTGLLHAVERGLHLRSGGASSALAAGVVYLALQGTVLLVLFLTGYSVAGYLGTPAVTGPVLAATSLYVIRHCFRATIRELRRLTPAQGFPSEGRSLLERWLCRTTRLWPQIALSLVAVAVGVALTYAFRAHIRFSYQHNAATFLGFAMFLFFGGQGAYWGLAMVSATRYLRATAAAEFAPDLLCPSQTPILVFVSRVLSTYLVCIALVATFCILSFFSARPDLHSQGALGLGILMGSIYLFTSWVFLYTQWNLWGVVRAVKMRSLVEIRRKASGLYERLANLDAIEIAELQQLMDLHESIRATPNTMVRFSGVLYFLSALLLQTLAAIPGILALLRSSSSVGQ